MNETWQEDATDAPAQESSEISPDGSSDASSLGQPSLAVLARALGLTEAEQTIYAHLLKEDLPARELAARIGIAVKAVTSLLQSLTAKGLVRRLGARSPRFGVIAPSAALPALLRQREAELDSAREAAKRVVQAHSRRLVSGQADRDDYVEIVFGSDALRTQFHMLESGARSEICACTKLPIVLFPVEAAGPEENEALRRGVSIRALYEEGFLELPGAVEHIREAVRVGEQSRVLPSLPAKLFIFDRRIALIHATEVTAQGPQIVGVVMRHPELVTTLQELFDLMWQVATPMPHSVDEGSGGSVEDGSDDEALILSLAAGMKDASIARQLGLSHRTVARRVGRLQERLRATSRFQAGYRLGLESASATSSPAPGASNVDGGQSSR